MCSCIQVNSVNFTGQGWFDITVIIEGNHQRDKFYNPRWAHSHSCKVIIRWIRNVTSTTLWHVCYGIVGFFHSNESTTLFLVELSSNFIYGSLRPSWWTTPFIDSLAKKIAREIAACIFHQSLLQHLHPHSVGSLNWWQLQANCQKMCKQIKRVINFALCHLQLCHCFGSSTELILPTCRKKRVCKSELKDSCETNEA